MLSYRIDQIEMESIQIDSSKMIFQFDSMSIQNFDWNDIININSKH